MASDYVLKLVSYNLEIMAVSTRIAHSYADVGPFLTARDLARLTSTCGMLGSLRRDFACAVMKAQHGYMQKEDSCFATLTLLKTLENIPDSCAIRGLESLKNAWMLLKKLLFWLLMKNVKRLPMMSVLK